MSEPNTRVQGSEQSSINIVPQASIPSIIGTPTPQQATIVDQKARAFTDKLMELISEVYTLSLEIASIDDEKLLKHPAIVQARKVVQKVKELRDVLGTK